MTTLALTKTSQFLMDQAIKITGQSPNVITKKALEIYVNELVDYQDVKARKSERSVSWEKVKKDLGL